MSLQEGDWLYNKIANRHVQTYVKGFLDVSGGDVILRNGNLNVGGRSDLSGDTVMHQNANVRGLIKQSDTVIEGGFIYKEITSSEVQDTLDDLNELKTTIDSIITTEVDNGVDVINIGSVNNKIVIGDHNTFAQGNQGLITENQSNFNLINIGSKTSLTNVGETIAGTTTLVGKDALNDMNYNVFHNTAVGFNSGNGIIDGTMNTFLGSGSGASSDISNSTAIGYNSIVTSSNKFLLGPNTGTLQDVIIPGNVEANGKLFVSQTIGVGVEQPDVAVEIGTTDAILIPRGTTADRPYTIDEATNGGYIRYNTTNHQFEGFGPGGSWGSLGGIINVAQNTKVLASYPNADSTNNELMFFTAVNGSTDSADALERMRITNTGDISMNNNLSVGGDVSMNDSNVSIGTIIQF
jgi:hypothetical protein